jgi:4-hydroxy-tetrahydrodipicolinate reductase
MRIALVGYGKMGQEIQRLSDKVEIIIDPHSPKADFTSISLESLKGCDVAIDFTTPSCVLKNIYQYLNLGIPAVIGTTGWYDNLSEVSSKLEEVKGSLFYTPNFSIGIHLFFRMVRQAAKLMNPFKEYDVSGFEAHHRLKADSPSGTAEKCAEILLEESNQKHSVCYDSSKDVMKETTLHFPSLRCGMMPGTHQVLFDSYVDSISLTHTARSREGFAYGALKAAEWLQNKKGLFTMDDLLNGSLS